MDDVIKIEIDARINARHKSTRNDCGMLNDATAFLCVYTKNGNRRRLLPGVLSGQQRTSFSEAAPDGVSPPPGAYTNANV